MDTNDEWIRSGSASPNAGSPARTTRSISMGARASAKALAEAGLQPDRHRHDHRRDLQPWTRPVPHAATQIAGALGIHAPGLLRHQRRLRRVLLRHRRGRPGGPGRAPRRTCWSSAPSGSPTGPIPTDRATAIIFADGAGAAVVSAGSDEPGIGPVVWGSDETNIDAIRIEGRNGHFIQEGQTVFRWATTKIGPVAIRAAEAAGVGPGRCRRAGHPPGEPADHRRHRQEGHRGRRPTGPQGRPGTS